MSFFPHQFFNFTIHSAFLFHSIETIFLNMAQKGKLPVCSSMNLQTVSSLRAEPLLISVSLVPRANGVQLHHIHIYLKCSGERDREWGGGLGREGDLSCIGNSTQHSNQWVCALWGEKGEVNLPFLNQSQFLCLSFCQTKCDSNV